MRSTGRVGLPESACLLWRLHWNIRAEHLIGLNSCPFTAIDLLWNPECQETRCFPLHGGSVLYIYLKSGFSVREIQSFPRKTGLNYAQIPSKKGFAVLDVQVGQMVTPMWRSLFLSVLFNDAICCWGYITSVMDWRMRLEWRKNKSTRRRNLTYYHSINRSSLMDRREIELEPLRWEAVD